MIFRPVLYGLLTSLLFSGVAFAEPLPTNQDRSIEIVPNPELQASLQPEIDEDFGPSEDPEDEVLPVEDSGLLYKFERAMWALRQHQMGQPILKASEKQIFQFAEQVVEEVYSHGTDEQKSRLLDSFFAKDFEDLWNYHHNPVRAAFYEPQLWGQFKDWTFHLATSGVPLYFATKQFAGIARLAHHWIPASDVLPGLRGVSTHAVDLQFDHWEFTDGARQMLEMSLNGISSYRASFETLAASFFAGGREATGWFLNKYAKQGNKADLAMAALAITTSVAGMYLDFALPPGTAELQVAHAAWSTLKVVPDIWKWGNEAYRFGYERKNPIMLLRAEMAEISENIVKPEGARQ